MKLFPSIFLLTSVYASDPNNRMQKYLSMFNIVKFENGACEATGVGKMGTCYTAKECETRKGQAMGSCASGYGVCCTFSGSCGQSFSENCTYFESTGGESGDCSMEICQCRDNICQLRLDFSTFVINGPSSETLTLTKLLYGTPGVATGEPVTTATQCNVDAFSVTNPGGGTPPVVCGTLSDEHMYVDASESCNVLTFALGATAAGVVASNRQWSIKVTQYSCSYNNLAPTGCTQYFFGNDGQGTVKTFNFDSGIHLANQNQNICIRREANQCQVCYTVTAVTTDFEVGGTKASGFIGKSSKCCGYGVNGKDKDGGFDCALIPSASKKTGTMILNGGFCGNRFATTSGAVAAPKQVCSQRVPFRISFLSDNYEWDGEALLQQAGFRLQYEQNGAC